MVSKRAVLKGLRAASGVKKHAAECAVPSRALQFHTHRAVGSQVGEQHNADGSQWTKLLSVVLTGLGVAASLDDSRALNEAKVALPPVAVDVEKMDAEEVPEPKPRGRRQLLKKRTKHTAKLEEVDLMKVHLDEYKKNHKEIVSLRARFDAYASKTIGSGDTQTRAMTFTNFLHSLILPRFHLQSPVRDPPIR